MHLYGLLRRWERKPDISHLPDVCYIQCNSAYTEAHQLGKSPRLCNAISPFQGDYNFCVRCVTINAAANEVAPALWTFVVPEFSDYIAYCASITNETSPQEQRSIVASQSSQNVQFSSILAQASANGLLNVTITSTTSGNIATATIAQIPGPTTTPNLSQISNGSQPEVTRRAAVIAGAVIGPVILITIMLVIFVWWKLKKRIERYPQEEQPIDEVGKWDGGGYKAQLHGDSCVPHELEGDIKAHLPGEIHEFEGDSCVPNELEGISKPTCLAKYTSLKEIAALPALSAH